MLVLFLTRARVGGLLIVCKYPKILNRTHAMDIAT